MVLNKTTCHMCDSWYFPMFLLWGGSPTLMYMSSLMVLVKLCDSLPQNGEVILTGLMTYDAVMVIIRRRGPNMFLMSFNKCPGRLPNILLMVHTVMLIPINHSTLLCDMSLSLGATRRFFDGADLL